MSTPVRGYWQHCSVFAVLSIALVFPSQTVLAQEEEGFVMEELVVTARKREEQLQDVPIAISAFNGDQIEDLYGNDLGEFSKYTPNVILTRQSYAGNALFGGIRGIVFGDLEKSFDPAVGVVVDGVALVNNTGALIDTFDLESVEILRGPQGTLFGRNTIAGVVNVRRSRPTGEFSLKTQVRYGSYDETDVKAVLNFAASETLAVKIAAFMDKGDGYQEEATFDLATGVIDGTGDQIDGEDTINVYASFLFNPTENFEALLTLEYGNDESQLSTPTNLTVPNIEPLWGAATGSMFAQLGAGVDPGIAVGGTIGAILAPAGSNPFGGGNFCDVYGAVFAPLNGWVSDIACASQGYLIGEENGYEYSYTAQPFINEIESYGATLEMNWELGEYTLTSITGWRKADEILDEDNLGTPVFVFNPIRPQESDQLSTELRLASNYTGNFNFQAGLYYVKSEYEITQSVHVFGPAETTPPNPDGDAGQEIEAFAIFGEAYWNLTDAARLTLGGRFTRETKEVFIFQRVSGDASGLLPGIWGCGNLNPFQQSQADAAAAAHIASAPTPEIAAARTAALTCNDANGKDSWTEFTPRVSLDYQFTDDIMGYISWSRGFRSGGWNGRATTPTSIGPYDPETVDSYEIGVRTNLLDNRLTFNATAFRADYQDKHESTIFQFGQATETIVENAAQATIEGVELEMRLVPSSRMQIRASVGWTDGEYDEYLGVNRLTGDREDISDIFEFGFAPEWNYSVGFDYLHPLGDMGTLLFAANYSWADETTGNFGQPDPSGFGRNEFDDRGEADFALTWENRWLNVAAFVKDAFHDDNYLATSVDVGVFWFGAVEPGRTWGIELTKTFQ